MFKPVPVKHAVSLFYSMSNEHLSVLLRFNYVLSLANGWMNITGFTLMLFTSKHSFMLKTTPKQTGTN